MQAMDLLKRNLEYMERCNMVQKSRAGMPKSVQVEEEENFYDVVLNGEDKIRVKIREDFDFETFLQGETLEICNLMSINVYYVLATILRYSEYCGFDNKVYLHYTDISIFYAVASLLDFTVAPFLNKFYVCFDDGKKELKYSGNEKRIQIDEMETLVFFYQPSNCGWQFFKDIIKRSSYVIYADGYRMHRRIEEIENELNQAGEIKKIFLNGINSYKCHDVINTLRRFPDFLSEIGYDYDRILSSFIELFQDNQAMTISDIFKGLLIAKYYADSNEEKNKRILPIIVYFPDHYQRFMEYYEDICNSFQKVLFFRTVRNPVIRVVRAYEHMRRYNIYNFVKYLDVLFEEFYYDEYSIKSNYCSYAVRFEDLKQNPKEYMVKICDCFGIPYEDILINDEKMFRLDALAPMINEELFSELDIKVFEKIFSPILEHYQYATVLEKINFDSIKEYCFKFETHMAESMNIDKEFIRMGIRKRLEELEKREELVLGFPQWIK